MDNINYKQKISQLKTIISEDLTETIDIVIPFHIYYKKMMQEVKVFLEENYDLSKSELDLLVSLSTTEDNSGTLAPTELYDHLVFSSGGMTKLLKKLEMKEYIIRIENPEDKRSKLVQITSIGKELAIKAMNEVVRLEAQYFSKLTKNEKSVLHSALGNLVFERKE